MPCLPFDSCLHPRLEGDVSGGTFDDHRTVRGLCPDCCEYIVVTDYASTLSTSRKMTQQELVAWHRETCFGITCTECDTDFGAVHQDECGDTCQRAPGSDICLQCSAQNEAMAYYGSLYRAGALGPVRSEYNDREEFEAAVIDAGMGHLL
jgi:hypothetical protein